MRFAIAAIDRYLGVFEAFVNAGWTPLKLFTMPAKSELDSQQAVMAYAEQRRAAIQLSRITMMDLKELRERGCEALVVASYNWKIGDWTPFLKYAVSFHASPLPDGRGAYPPVRAILENRNSWGVTCHRISSEIDKGDILGTEEFPLQPDECHESIDLKIQMAAKRLASRAAYWQKYKVEERIIDFQKPVEETVRHIRAFGKLESLAYVNYSWLMVKRAVGWVEKHNYAPGRVMHVFNRSIVVAAWDGYIGLLEADMAPSHITSAI